MRTFEEMLKEFESVESGMPRLNAIRGAITEADERGDLYWQFQMRYAYLKESIFCGDRYFAMIIFPQLLALYEEHEKLRQNRECDFDMLVAFKWIVEAAPEFPQISKAEIDGYFRMFKRLLLEHGCSLSIYHMKRNLFYLHIDRGIAAAEFYRFLDAPLDSISDGKALYYDQQAMYYLFIGNEEKALEAAKPIFSGEMVSNALPQATYQEFIRFYLNRGDYEKAMDYAKKTEHRVTGNPYYLDITGTLLSLYSVTQPEHGLQLFARNYSIYANSRNPLLRMQFAIGAYHLFRALPDEQALPESLASKDAEISGMGVPELRFHFHAAAQELAQKFDARNGTNDFMTKLNCTYPDTQRRI